MSLDLSTRLILRLLHGKTQGGQMPRSLDQLRAVTDRQMAPLWVSRLPLAGVEERRIPGPAGPMRLRLYRPRGRLRGLVLFLHGGGFVHCGLDSHDGICCRLARASRCLVASLEYRLAPEHKFPAALDDGEAALRWLTREAAALGLPVAVAGDSAGGNLAAVLCRRARNRGLPPPAFQLLYYPPTHGMQDVPSRHAYATGYFLTTDLMQWYRDAYLDGEADHADPDFAPFLAEDLAGLPPALIVTAEYDPLRDEGAEYAERLRAAGVDVDYRCWSGVIHGFLNFYPVQAKGRRAIRQGGRAIRRALVAAQARPGAPALDPLTSRWSGSPG